MILAEDCLTLNRQPFHGQAIQVEVASIPCYMVIPGPQAFTDPLNGIIRPMLRVVNIPCTVVEVEMVIRIVGIDPNGVGF